MSSPRRFHVTYKDYKKIVTVNNVELLTDQIYNDFNIHHDLDLQYFSTEFDDWVDIDDLSKIPNASRIRAVNTETCYGSGDEVSPSASISSDNGACDDIPNIPEITVVKIESADWISSYQLPTFPKHVLQQIESCSRATSESILPRIRKQIVDILYNSMINHTVYPSRHEYAEVCGSLVRNFPMLKDRYGSRGCYYHSWLISVKGRFKDHRRSLNGPEHDEMRRKYGHAKGKKRLCDEDLASASVTRCKEARSHSDLITLQSADNDDFSRIQHNKAITNEIKKKSPSSAILKDRLERTFQRRKDILEGKNTTLSFQKKKQPILEMAEEYTLKMEFARREHEAKMGLIESKLGLIEAKRERLNRKTELEKIVYAKKVALLDIQLG